MKANKAIEAKIKQVEDELKRTRLFLDLLTCIRDSGFSMEALAKRAGIANATMYFWLAGHTKHPRIDTIHKVASALGFDIRLYRTEKVVPTKAERRMKAV